jgi:hypothetical protein
MGVQCLIAWFFVLMVFVNLSFALLCITSDNNFLRAFRVVQQNYNEIKKQREISQNFQNKMCFSLLHYTSKKEKKGHECFKNKIKIIASFQYKENLKFPKDACNKNSKKKKKSKKFQPYIKDHYVKMSFQVVI